MMANFPYRNLVFEGGGVKGLAYAGALEVLDEAGITGQIERVGGASAGAITATLVCLGYTAAEIKSTFMSMDFKKFEDGGFTGPERLLMHYGWFKGDFFLNFIEGQIAQKTGNPRATFADVTRPNFKDLYVMGTELTEQRSVVFSAEHTKDVAIADAVRISMSIPLFFAARTIGDKIYCDGGVLNNYPITLFDELKYLSAASDGDPELDVTNPETLGFHLDNLNRSSVRKIDSLARFGGGVYEALVNIQSNLLMSNPDDVKRSVFINDLGVKTTDFHLKDEQKLALIESGRSATLKYLFPDGDGPGS
jgi:NTE family protein